MYARSTTIRGNPRRLDAGIAYVRDAGLPAVRWMAGCVGLSMLCDREDGRTIVTTAWADYEAMLDSRARTCPSRDRAAAILEGRPEVAEWEIGVVHRLCPTPEGGCARVTWLEGDAGDFDRALERFTTAVMPHLDQLDGLCSVSVLLDRETGRAVLAAGYRDRAALDASCPQVQLLRDEFILRMNHRIREIAVMEVALAHLRVPETV
jgi:quinol monooxygenase YgiN